MESTLIPLEKNPLKLSYKRLKAIEEISYACSNLLTADLAFASHKVLTPFCELTGANYGLVFLLKNPEKQLYLEAVYGLDKNFAETYNNKLKFTIDSSDVNENWPSLRSISKKQIVIIKDTNETNVEHSKFFLDTISPSKIRSIISIPIIINNEAVGAITKFFVNEHTFDEEEISFIKATANIITSTIERNLLVESARKSEKELAHANEILRNINQELDSFVYIASHDLREPLRTIESFVSVIQDKLNTRLQKDEEDYLIRIVNATKRMRRLIEDLTQLSRATRGAKEKEYIPIDLNLLLAEVQFELTAFIKNKNAEIIIPDRLPEVCGNSEKMTSVFKNLISNGIKFNKSKKPKIIITMAEDFNFDPLKACICIEDNGIGIEKEYQKKIFGLFQRLHSQEEYEGTGAGLAIVKKILEKYGCEIWLESQKEKGSKFFFTLLRADARR